MTAWNLKTPPNAPLEFVSLNSTDELESLTIPLNEGSRSRWTPPHTFMCLFQELLFFPLKETGCVSYLKHSNGNTEVKNSPHPKS